MTESLVLDIINALNCRVTQQQELCLVDVLEHHRLYPSVDARIQTLAEALRNLHREAERVCKFAVGWEPLSVGDISSMKVATEEAERALAGKGDRARTNCPDCGRAWGRVRNDCVCGRKKALARKEAKSGD